MTLQTNKNLNRFCSSLQTRKVPQRVRLLLSILVALLFMVSLLISVSSIDDTFIDILAMGIVRNRIPRLGGGDVHVPSTAHEFSPRKIGLH